MTIAERAMRGDAAYAALSALYAILLPLRAHFDAMPML